MTNDEKMCPFMSWRVQREEYGAIYIPEVRCVRDRCAAWDSRYRRCSVLTRGIA